MDEIRSSVSSGSILGDLVTNNNSNPVAERPSNLPDIPTAPNNPNDKSTLKNMMAMASIANTVERGFNTLTTAIQKMHSSMALRLDVISRSLNKQNLLLEKVFAENIKWHKDNDAFNAKGIRLSDAIVRNVTKSLLKLKDTVTVDEKKFQKSIMEIFTRIPAFRNLSMAQQEAGLKRSKPAYLSALGLKTIETLPRMFRDLSHNITTVQKDVAKIQTSYLRDISVSMTGLFKTFQRFFMYFHQVNRLNERRVPPLTGYFLAAKYGVFKNIPARGGKNPKPRQRVQMESGYDDYDRSSMKMLERSEAHLKSLKLDMEDSFDEFAVKQEKILTSVKNIGLYMARPGSPFFKAAAVFFTGLFAYNKLLKPMASIIGQLAGPILRGLFQPGHFAFMTPVFKSLDKLLIDILPEKYYNALINFNDKALAYIKTGFNALFGVDLEKKEARQAIKDSIMGMINPIVDKIQSGIEKVIGVGLLIYTQKDFVSRLFQGAGNQLQSVPFFGNAKRSGSGPLGRGDSLGRILGQAAFQGNSKDFIKDQMKFSGYSDRDIGRILFMQDVAGKGNKKIRKYTDPYTKAPMQYLSGKVSGGLKYLDTQAQGVYGAVYDWVPWTPNIGDSNYDPKKRIESYGNVKGGLGRRIKRIGGSAVMGAGRILEAVNLPIVSDLGGMLYGSGRGIAGVAAGKTAGTGLMSAMGNMLGRVLPSLLGKLALGGMILPLILDGFNFLVKPLIQRFSSKESQEAFKKNKDSTAVKDMVVSTFKNVAMFILASIPGVIKGIWSGIKMTGSILMGLTKAIAELLYTAIKWTGNAIWKILTSPISASASLYNTVVSWFSGSPPKTTPAKTAPERAAIIEKQKQEQALKDEKEILRIKNVMGAMGIDSDMMKKGFQKLGETFKSIQTFFTDKKTKDSFVNLMKSIGSMFKDIFGKLGDFSGKMLGGLGSALGGFMYGFMGENASGILDSAIALGKKRGWTRGVAVLSGAKKSIMDSITEAAVKQLEAAEMQLKTAQDLRKTLMDLVKSQKGNNIPDNVLKQIPLTKFQRLNEAAGGYTKEVLNSKVRVAMEHGKPVIENGKIKLLPYSEKKTKLPIPRYASNDTAATYAAKIRAWKEKGGNVEVGKYGEQQEMTFANYLALQTRLGLETSADQPYGPGGYNGPMLPESVIKNIRSHNGDVDKANLAWATLMSAKAQGLNINPAYLMSQSLLETNWYSSSVLKDLNNTAGMKTPINKASGVVHVGSRPAGDGGSYAIFGSVADSMRHRIWYDTAGRYGGQYGSGASTNVDDWARNLRARGYYTGSPDDYSRNLRIITLKHFGTGGPDGPAIPGTDVLMSWLWSIAFGKKDGTSGGSGLDNSSSGYLGSGSAGQGLPAGADAKKVFGVLIPKGFKALTGKFHEQRGSHVHQGIDLAASQGSPIYSPLSGKVTFAGYNSGGYGNLVKVDNGNGLSTRFAHMQGYNVKSGQTVAAGAQIGLVGNTGRSSGPHLHYEMRQNNVPVNPIDTLIKISNSLPGKERGGPGNRVDSTYGLTSRAFDVSVGDIVRSTVGPAGVSYAYHAADSTAANMLYNKPIIVVQQGGTTVATTNSNYNENHNSGSDGGSSDGGWLEIMGLR